MSSLLDIFVEKTEKGAKPIIPITSGTETLIETSPTQKNTTQQEIEIINIPNDLLLVDLNVVKANINIFKNDKRCNYRKNADYAMITDDTIIFIEMTTSLTDTKFSKSKYQLLSSKCFLEYCINLKRTIDNDFSFMKDYKIKLICLYDKDKRREFIRVGKSKQSHNNKINYYSIHAQNQVDFDKLLELKLYPAF